MTTINLPRAVVEQALEALTPWMDSDHTVQHAAYHALRAALAKQRLTDAQQEMERSIESLKAALAQQAEPVADPFNCPKCGRHDYGLHGACPTCDAQKAEPWERRVALAEQLQMQQAEPVEPYCHVYEYDGVFGLHREFYPKTYNGIKPSRTVPVYTAPPQRKPLTDEEIDKVSRRWVPVAAYMGLHEHAEMTQEQAQQSMRKFARAVERAHGIPMPEGDPK